MPIDGQFDGVVVEQLGTGGGAATVDFASVVIEQLSSTFQNPFAEIDNVVLETLVSSPPQQGPIPLFPALPYGFPIGVNPRMLTLIGTGPTDIETRANQQIFPLWEFELPFEELRDQTQNQSPYVPMTGFTEYEQLVQLWLVNYGTGGLFAFDAPWDNSRQNQVIGTGDGATYVFRVFRAWGQNPAAITEPVGVVNQVFEVKLNGVVLSPTKYRTYLGKIVFEDAAGIAYPPGAGVTISMTFSFYYLCRFQENEQDYEEFSKGRWTVKSLKFQSVIWG